MGPGPRGGAAVMAGECGARRPRSRWDGLRVRILVTGAARAIGRATVEVLASRGHAVVATARDVSLLADLPAEQILPLDVSDGDSVTAAIGQAGELDAVVNNAGLPGLGPL